MNQRVISSHFPYLPLTLTIQEQTETVEALLDTGFDGDVVVPANLVSDEKPPDGYLQWTLADGSQVQAPGFLGTIKVGTLGPFPAVIIALGDEPIIGRSLTDRFTVILDHG